jgi:histidine triad (HIT) family protein
MSQDTVFHKIARKEAPAYIFYEDDSFMAFLDIFPAFYGQSVLIPKQFAPSKFSDTNTEVLKEMMVVGQKVAKLLETKLDNIQRCIVMIEGFDVDYLHLKLYPAGPDTRGKEALFEPPTIAPKEELDQIFTLLTSTK